MKKILSLLCLMFGLLTLPTWSQPNPSRLKVFISVDMEGIGGVVHSDQTSASGGEYNRARKLMVEEVNAAIAGALEAGATEILANDSHGSMRNIVLEDLRPPAQLISNFFEITFSTTAHADIAEQIPTVTRQDAKTISFATPDYLQGYRLLRVLYRYLRAD